MGLCPSWVLITMAPRKWRELTYSSVLYCECIIYCIGGNRPKTGGDRADGEGEGPRGGAPDERAGAPAAETRAEWEDHEPHLDRSQPRVPDAHLGQDSSRLGRHAGGRLE